MTEYFRGVKIEPLDRIRGLISDGHFTGRKILLKPGLPEERRQVVLLHEWLHAAWFKNHPRLSKIIHPKAIWSGRFLFFFSCSALQGLSLIFLLPNTLAIGHDLAVYQQTGDLKRGTFSAITEIMVLTAIMVCTVAVWTSTLGGLYGF